MEYLEKKAFAAKYSQHWEQCKTEKFKLEVLPEYDEFNVKDWSKVTSSKTNELIHGVQRDVAAWLDGKKINENGRQFQRIRYIPFPLTKYLLIELSSYATSQALGTKIDIIEDSDLDKIEDLKPFFCDFLLFDDQALFKLDNPGGIVPCASYYTQDPEEIAPYIALKERLKQISQPLDDYMRLLNIQFIQSMPYEKQT